MSLASTPTTGSENVTSMFELLVTIVVPAAGVRAVTVGDTVSGSSSKTVIVRFLELPRKRAVMVAFCVPSDTLSSTMVTSNVADELPAGTVTVYGTRTISVSLEESLTFAEVTGAELS